MNKYQYPLNPLQNVDPLGLTALELVLTGLAADVAVPEPSDVIPWKWVGWGFVITGVAIYTLTCENTKEEEECSPPVGTKCYEGPDYGRPHAGLSPHYHLFQMFKFAGKCQWKYLGGKVGKGVVATPPIGVQACSGYLGFQGR